MLVAQRRGSESYESGKAQAFEKIVSGVVVLLLSFVVLHACGNRHDVSPGEGCLHNETHTITGDVSHGQKTTLQ